MSDTRKKELHFLSFIGQDRYINVGYRYPQYIKERKKKLHSTSVAEGDKTTCHIIQRERGNYSSMPRQYHRIKEDLTLRKSTTSTFIV